MQERFFIIREGDSITFGGVDMGGRGKILHENKNIVVIKFPAGKHFAGRGFQGYHSPSTYVLEKDQAKPGWGSLIVSWANKRK